MHVGVGVTEHPRPETRALLIANLHSALANPSSAPDPTLAPAAPPATSTQERIVSPSRRQQSRHDPRRRYGHLREHLEFFWRRRELGERRRAALSFSQHFLTAVGTIRRRRRRERRHLGGRGGGFEEGRRGAAGGWGEVRGRLGGGWGEVGGGVGVGLGWG